MTADREDRVPTVGVESSQGAAELAAVGGVNPELAARPLSPEERQQLEERARARLADPEYQRRVRATDRLVRSLIPQQPQ